MKYDNRLKNVSHETTFFNTEKIIGESNNKSYSFILGSKNDKFKESNNKNYSTIIGSKNK